MNNLRSKLSNLKNACHIFRHYLRWPYPMYKPSQFDSFNHEHTCLASKPVSYTHLTLPTKA